MEQQHNTIWENIRSNIQELLTVEGMTQSALGKKFDVSEATINLIARGRKEQISDKMLEKLRVKLNMNNWQLRKTDNFVAIQQLCERTREKSLMTAISAPTGLGKSEGVKYFVRTHATAFYVRALPIHNVRTFLEDLQNSFGCRRGSSIKDMRDVLIRSAGHITKPLLIIDDAHKLKDHNWQVIYDLKESLDGLIGILLVGTENLKKQFERRVARDVTGFRELYRRINYWEPLYPVNAQMVEVICKDYGISDPNALRYIKSTARDYDTLKHMVMNVTEMAERAGEPVTREMLMDIQLGDAHYQMAK